MHGSGFLHRTKVPAAALAALLVSSIQAPCAGAAAGESPGESPAASFRLAEEVFELHHAVAFRTTELKSRPGEEVTVVVLTEESVDKEEVAAAVKEKGNWTGSGHLRLILRFESDGDLFWGIFQGHGNNLQLEPDRIEAAVEVGASRVGGTLSQTRPSEFFDDEYLLESASFSVPILDTRR
jgi:hypothetical protein